MPVPVLPVNPEAEDEPPPPAEEAEPTTEASVPFTPEAGTFDADTANTTSPMTPKLPASPSPVPGIDLPAWRLNRQDVETTLRELLNVITTNVHVQVRTVFFKLLFIYFLKTTIIFINLKKRNKSSMLLKKGSLLYL